MGGLDESDADREAMVKDNKQWVGAATNDITAEKKNRKHDGLRQSDKADAERKRKEAWNQAEIRKKTKKESNELAQINK